MIPALTLVLVFHGHLLLCRSWRPCVRFIRAGANDRWNLNLLLKNDRAGPQAGLGFHGPYLLSLDFTSVRLRAGHLQPELLLLVAPSLPVNDAGLQIGSEQIGCVDSLPILGYPDAAGLDISLGFHGPCPPFFSDRRDSSFAFTGMGAESELERSQAAQKSSVP